VCCRRAVGNKVQRDGPSGGGDFWQKKPCINKRPEVAIRYHEHGRPPSKPQRKNGAPPPKKAKVAGTGAQTYHQKAAAVLSENRSIIASMQKQFEKEESAIRKRLMAADHLARQYQSFNSFGELVTLLGDTGAFHDCPHGKEAGSAESAGASYASRTSCTGLLHALTLATRVFWLAIIVASLRGSMMADETGDDAQHTPMCSLYKVLLPNGLPVVVYAGMEVLPRSTAAVIKGALLHRLTLDGIPDVESWLALACWRCCRRCRHASGGVT
jgi:hypothetical protein